MHITFYEGHKNDIIGKLNEWQDNGWNLTSKFVKIAGGGNSGWFTVFYDRELDYKNYADLSSL